ncbi:MAG: hypothetical protein DCF32_07650 [Leptolyngbya sp.]|nr:MAG: hypothetical protein DCF32_07650 [Leptolyngbya sp.]
MVFITLQPFSLSDSQFLPQNSTSSQYYKRYLETVCDNATLALFVMDEFQHCVYMNPAAEQLTGFMLDEVQGRALHDIIHHTRPDGSPYPLCECPIDQAFPQNNQEQGEEVFVHRDGHFYPVAYTASPIREGGQPIGTVIEVRDITQEKLDAQARQDALNLERQLRQEAEQAKARLDITLQSITDSFAVLDREWRYVYVNQAAIATLGKTESELIGQSFWDIFPDVIGTRLEAEYRRAVSEQCTVEFENFYAGWNRWYHNRLYPSETGVSIFFADITERKQTEAALQEAEERLRLAIESTRLGTWDFNLVTQQIEWDEGCRTMFGVPSDAEVTYETFLTALHQDDRDRVDQLVTVAIAPGGSGEFKSEYRAIGITDSVERWIDASGKALFDASGKAIRLIGTVLDITEAKEREAERQELLNQEKQLREQAEQANRIKDEFLAVLSHELRTPLNPILGWVKMLKAQKCPPPKIPQVLDTIERNAQLQAQLIEDLLDVSRILQGKIVLDTDLVSLADIVKASLETVQLAAEAKSIDIKLNLEFSGSVRGDRNRLQQVFWNLLSNSVKFTPIAGRVEVTVSQVGTNVQIQICDTGKGIRAEVLPYIFDRFRQADSSTTRQFGGLGLGLAISRHFIELHGGTITAESLGENQGATFTVKLPITLAQSQSCSGSGSPESKPDLFNVKILVVDDEQDNLDFLVFLLEAAGAIVQGVNSATLALEKLDPFAPDLLISDIAMPDLDGYEFIKRVRQQRTTPAETSLLPKAIALTAYAGEVNHRQILAAGFQKHLSKPVDPDNLINEILSLLRD